MPEDVTDIGAILGFKPAWYTLGVVNQAFLELARTKWETREDDRTEHYRYWAFREFLAAHRPLSPDLALALYELGAADQDETMGGAIMVSIVSSPECPESVLSAAAASGRRHLVRAVERRRADTNP